MGYHPRIETSDIATFQTTRCRNSELWFVNNHKLEESILAYVAKYCERYHVDLYAFAIEGNHIQFPALFPLCNRASFMRDLNSSIARAVPRYTSSYSGGRLWQRRYSAEFLHASDDVEEWFFYTVLQPVQDGLVSKISEYPGYNCFHDAVYGITRTFKVVNWTAYNEHRKWNSRTNLSDFVEEVTLTYKRLPGYEALSRKEYADLMHKKLEERRVQILKNRRAHGLPVGDGKFIKQTLPGSLPKRTKVSTRSSHRPRVLCVSSERRGVFNLWYFTIYFLYKEASTLYLSGQCNVPFPPGTYKPPVFTSQYSYFGALAA